MTVSRWAGAAILASMVLSGCRMHEEPPPPKPLAVPVSPETRTRIKEMAPKAIIGRVIAILPAERLVAVGDVQVQDFKPGDVLTFMGGEDYPLCNGVVVNILKDVLHIQCEQPAADRREPVVGDLAVRFPKP